MKKTLDEVREYFKSRGCELISTEYTSNAEPLEYIAACGHKNSMNWKNFHDHGHGSVCKRCSGKHRYTEDDVIDLLSKFGCKFLSCTYNSGGKAIDRVTFVHTCGHTCVEGLKTIITKKQPMPCPVCRFGVGEETVADFCILQKHSQEFVSSTFESAGCRLISKYENAYVKVHYIAKCGHEHCIRFNDFLNGHGVYCPSCANKIRGESSRKTKEEIEAEFLSRGCKILEYPENGQHSFVTYIASCGHINKIRSCAFFVGQGTVCPECAQNNLSERVCGKFLDEIFGNVERQWTIFTDGKKHQMLDFYVPDRKLAIEYNGIQHYQFIPFFHRDEHGFAYQQERDERKRRWCKEHGIILVEIDGRKLAASNMTLENIKSLLPCNTIGD